jgi:hypothetical protein
MTQLRGENPLQRMVFGVPGAEIVVWGKLNEEIDVTLFRIELIGTDGSEDLYACYAELAANRPNHFQVIQNYGVHHAFTSR